MAVESIRAQLDARYKEIKEGKKPDFLDVDKDGDKKEPMTKALKDKKVAEGGRDAYERDFDSSRTGFGPRDREDDEGEDMDEGFDSNSKPGDTFKTRTGTATMTKSGGVTHIRDKYDYDPGSDDKDDKKQKRDAKKKKRAARKAEEKARAEAAEKQKKAAEKASTQPR